MKRTTLKRYINAKINQQRLSDPSLFLSPKRIDIAAKTIFARAYIEESESSWPEFVYKEHLRAFNGFVEKEPQKNSYKDFLDSFINTIHGVQHDDSWKHLSPIEQHNGYLVNGAHRVAASITAGDKVNTKTLVDTEEYNYDWHYFSIEKHNAPAINESVLDYMTIEYVTQKKKNIFVAIVFPTAEGHRKEAYDHLLSLGEIVNMKTFNHDEFVGKEVIKQLYFDSQNDDWNIGMDFRSAQYKADLCFAGKEDLQVYVIEANLDEAARVKEKQYLRSLWGKDKHSVHITDSMDEANRVVRMFFNENSRRFMKIERKSEFASQKMYDMFQDYIKHTPRSFIEREKIAVEGSAVLDLLNLRPARDIDYISRDSTIKFKTESIEPHLEGEHKYHTQHIDEILLNPTYYFYYKGYKFIDITEIYQYKRTRASHTKDLKDIKDLKTIQRFLTKNAQYNYDSKMEKNKRKPQVGVPFFSIIIPLYNKAEHLATCLENIQDQLEESWECIIIDDGSTDTSVSVAREFSNGDERFKIFSQENSGPSIARNQGIRMSRGTLLHFLDADDFYPNIDTLKKIKQIYLKNKKKPFALAGNIGLMRSQGQIDYDLTVNSNKNRHQTFIDLQDDYYFTRFFFDRKFITDNSIYFPEYTYVGEDPVFLVKALSGMDKFYITNIPVYVYNTTASSNNNFRSYDNDKILGYLKAQVEILDIAKNKGYSLLSKNIINRIELSMLGIYTERAKVSKDIHNELCRLHSHIGIYEYYKKIRIIKSRDQTLKDLRLELDATRMPGVKLATRKLLGAIRRKIRKVIDK